MHVVKAHAYGNDFLLAPAGDSGYGAADFVRALCDRHRGIGADGVIFHTLRTGGAVMTLFNADGSRAELSGNGLRCLAAHVCRLQGLRPGARVTIDTEAGRKVLDLLDVEGSCYTLRAAMGPAEELRQLVIRVGDERVTATVLRMGNPQCVVLGPLPDEPTFARLGPALATHPLFPAGTNVEFAHVETPARVRILIWERGVGPTASSGTGTSAAAVAAAAHGGASRDLDVVSPGGTQQVALREDGVYLTGWAEIVFDGTWCGRPILAPHHEA